MTTETNEKTLAEIYARFHELVIPVILHEMIFKLAEANSFSEAYDSTEHLFKDVFYCGAEVYQVMLHKKAPTTGAKLEHLARLDAELNAYVDQVKVRVKATTTH